MKHLPMCLIAVLAFLLALSSGAFGQKRYLVNSQGETIPVKKGQSTKAALDRLMKNRLLFKPTQAGCDSEQMFSSSDDVYPPNAAETAIPHDVLAAWFQAPESGTIESVYVRLSGIGGYPYGAPTLDIHKAAIGRYSRLAQTTFPMGTDTTCWGTFHSTSDPDLGIAPFREDVTGPDTAWYSMYYLNHYYDTSSFPPAGVELWGNGGYPLTPPSGNADTIVGVAMSDLESEPIIGKDSAILISVSFPGRLVSGLFDSLAPAIQPIAGGVTGFNFEIDTYPVSFRATPSNYFWKFSEIQNKCASSRYANGEGPGGWVVYGPTNSLSIWYVLKSNSDVPPAFESMDVLHNTFSSASQVVTCTTLDCNYSGGPAGTASVDLAVFVNEAAASHMVMTTIDGGTTWEATMPGAACGSLVRYQMTATDVNGNSASSPTFSYSVLCAANQWFTFDSSYTPTSRAITDIAHNSGTAIDTSRFFNVAGGDQPDDDGSAGPFAMGSFPWFGDTMHYAWINVNGGIAVSKSATDTIAANFGGYAIGGGAILPYPQRNKFTADNTTNESGIGRNFIAPMYADLLLAVSGQQYGNIFHKLDTVHQVFIVEWAGVAEYCPNGTAVADQDTFCLVLRDTGGLMEFQYFNVGTHGVDSVCTVGLEADSFDVAIASPGYFQTNNWTYPYQTKPRTNWGIEILPTVEVCVADGWNLVSLPGREAENAEPRLAYPTTTANAFEYNARYIADTLLEPGRGYWMKFGASQCFPLPVICAPCLTIPVQSGWNLIGSLCSPVPVGNITPNGVTFPGGSAVFFGYNNGYSAVSEIVPGQAYWVKITGTDSLTMCSGGSEETPKASTAEAELKKLSSFTLRSGKSSQTLYIGNENDLTRPAADFELPPTPPTGTFDARFSSNGMVETYPAALVPSKEYEYVINLQSAAYPITIQYNNTGSDRRAFELSDGAGGRFLHSTTLMGIGSLRINNSAVKSLSLRLVTAAATPKSYALSQNYPNPFNPTTSVTVDLPNSGAVDLSVYDVLGRKIATIMSGEQTAGSHTVEWDGKVERGGAAPSGTYFIRMSASDFSAVKKILFMK